MVLLLLITVYLKIFHIIYIYIYTHVRMHISIIWYIYIYIDDHIQYIYIYTLDTIYIYMLYIAILRVCIFIYIMCKHVPLCQSNSEGGLLPWKTSMAMNLYILPVPPTWQWKLPCGRGTLFTHDNHGGFALILAMPPSKKHLGIRIILCITSSRW